MKLASFSPDKASLAEWPDLQRVRDTGHGGCSWQRIPGQSCRGVPKGR